MKKLLIVLFVALCLAIPNSAWALYGDTRPFYNQTATYGRTDTDVEGVSGKWLPFTLNIDGSQKSRLNDGEIQLTEYSVDTGTWNTYAQVDSTHQVGQTFQTTRGNNLLTEARIYAKNSGNTNIINGTYYLSIFEDTKSSTPLFTKSFNVALALNAEAWFSIPLGFPIFTYHGYFINIYSDTTDTGFRILASNSQVSGSEYSRGEAYLNRALYTTGVGVIDLVFKIYTQRVSLAYEPSAIPNDTSVVIIGTVPVTVDSPIVTTLSDTAVNIPDPVTVIQQDSAVNIPEPITANLGDSNVIVESGTMDVNILTMPTVTIDSPITIAGPMDVNIENTDVMVVNFDDMPDTLDIGNFPSSFGASITDTPPVLAKQDAADTYRTEAKIVNFPDMPDTFNIDQVNNISSVDKVDSGFFEIMGIPNVSAAQTPGNTYAVDIGLSPLPAGENKIGNVGLDDINSDSDAILTMPLETSFGKQGLMFLADTITYIPIQAADTWACSFITGAREVMARITLISAGASRWIVSDSPTYDSAGDTFAPCSTDFGNATLPLSVFRTKDAFASFGTVKAQKIVGQANAWAKETLPWVRLDANHYYGIHLENSGTNPTFYGISIEFYEL